MAALPTSDATEIEAPAIDDDPKVWRISVQYVTDEDGNRTHVIIPNEQFEKLLDDLEEVWCLRMLEAAKDEPGETMDAEEFFNLLDKERGWDTR